jgi:hypothetical protein
MAAPVPLPLYLNLNLSLKDVTCFQGLTCCIGGGNHIENKVESYRLVVDGQDEWRLAKRGVGLCDALCCCFGRAQKRQQNAEARQSFERTFVSQYGVPTRVAAQYAGVDWSRPTRSLKVSDVNQIDEAGKKIQAMLPDLIAMIGQLKDYLEERNSADVPELPRDISDALPTCFVRKETGAKEEYNEGKILQKLQEISTNKELSPEEREAIVQRVRTRILGLKQEEIASAMIRRFLFAELKQEKISLIEPEWMGEIENPEMLEVLRDKTINQLSPDEYCRLLKLKDELTSRGVSFGGTKRTSSSTSMEDEEPFLASELNDENGGAEGPDDALKYFLWFKEGANLKASSDHGARLLKEQGEEPWVKEMVAGYAGTQELLHLVGTKDDKAIQLCFDALPSFYQEAIKKGIWIHEGMPKEKADFGGSFFREHSSHPAVERAVCRLLLYHNSFFSAEEKEQLTALAAAYLSEDRSRIEEARAVLSDTVREIVDRACGKWTGYERLYAIVQELKQITLLMA